MRKIAVLLTCFNRREGTLACLATLHAQRGVDHVKVTVFLVDDGSTDGTSEAVRSRFPFVHLLHGDGTLFWNGGMRMAFAAAMQESFDAFVLLNDDTILCDDALRRLIDCAERQETIGRPAIVAGSTQSPVSGRLSYGGFIRQTSGIRMCFKPVETDPVFTVSCDTMNGNFTLIPADIAAKVGNLEERFQHQFGDLDYGLRARQAGFGVVVAPGIAGDCSENPLRGTWRDPNSTLAARWKNLNSPKGVPLREWLLFTRRHYGWRCLHYIFSPYLKTVFSSLLPKFVSASAGKNAFERL